MMLKREDVEKVFLEAKEQTDYLMGIYRLVFPDFERIERIEQWPSCSEWTWKEICKLAMAWDKEHCPHVMGGGAWMNHGFSSQEKSQLKNWQIDMETCQIIYKPETVGI
jgi:hypothetical protein